MIPSDFFHHPPPSSLMFLPSDREAKASIGDAMIEKLISHLRNLKSCVMAIVQGPSHTPALK